jgi:Ca2+-binding RTX toxin-like protein
VIFGKTNTEAVNLANISKVVLVSLEISNKSLRLSFKVLSPEPVQQMISISYKNDTLTGTSAGELFVSGLGDDILTGNGGTEVFNAGAADDTIIINDDNLAKLYSNTLSSYLLARVDGGGNTDTLKLAGASLNLDLTQIDNGRIQV